MPATAIAAAATATAAAIFCCCLPDALWDEVAGELEGKAQEEEEMMQ